MVPIKLILNNFMSYKKPNPLDFSSFNIACLVGDNGVGKSSILEAVSWALWGKTRAGSDDDLINQSADEMWVDLIFKVKNDKYKVIRKRSRKKRGHSELYLYSYSKKSFGFHSISEDKIADTQEKINKLLKVPYRVFINSAYLKQGKADEFTTKSAAERKEILTEILDLKLYDNLSTVARDKSKWAKNQAQLLKIQIEDLENETEQKSNIKKDYDKLKKKISNLENQAKIINIKFQKLSQKILTKQRLDQEKDNLTQKINDIIKRGRALKFESQENTGRINYIKNQIKNEKIIKQNYKKLIDFQQLEKKLSLSQIKLLELRRERATFESNKTRIESQISKIKKISKCPTCLRIMTKKEIDNIINNLKKELARDVLRSLKTIDLKIAKNNYHHDKHQKIKSTISKLEVFEEQKNELETNQAILGEKIKSQYKIEHQIEQLKNDYRRNKAKVDSLNQKIKKYQPVENQYKEIEDKKNELQYQISSQKENLGILSQKLNYILEAEKKLKQKLSDYKNFHQDSVIFLELADIFSKKGIQARIFETAIPEIENQANIILAKLTEDKMQVSLITQKKKKVSDDLIETLDIQIKDSLGIRKYEMFSGGEAFRINFALRIALSRFLAQRSGTKLQFLAIDEGFGTQDENGRIQLAKAINSIKDDFEKIIVITHIQELKDLFETRIDVYKDQEGSQIKIVY